jgi:hypothetical protein
MSASTILILMGIVTAFLLLHHSSKHNEEQSREELARLQNPPAMINNAPSIDVVGVAIAIIVVFVLVAGLQH